MQPATDASQQRPNVVFIMADDMGYGDVACFNPHSLIPTPNMDRLAAEGMRFTDAHSASAVCTPSRYAIITGRYCWRSRLKDNVLYGYEPPLIEPERLTVARLLREAGYATAAIGKWHLGLNYSAKPGTTIDFDAPLPWPGVHGDIEAKIDFTQKLTGGPTALGFDYFYGTSGCPTAQPPYGFIENDRFETIPTECIQNGTGLVSRPGMAIPGWDSKQVDPIFTDKAVQYIESRSDDDQPFFLYVGASAPHEPCNPKVVPDFAQGKSQAGSRGDMVWLFDWMVGQVMDALERTGQADNTLIIATSDNGALPGDKDPPIGAPNKVGAFETHGHKSCGDWRGYKAHIWEGGHREPLIARWPGTIPPNSTCDMPVGLHDFMATCANIVGRDLPAGAGEDSVSILAAMRGEPYESMRDRVLVYHSCFGAFSVRRGKWKCIFDTQGSGGWPPPRDETPQAGTPGQLYDMEADPSEQNNLWDLHPEIVRELAAVLESRKREG